jgi:hypothetical protein
VGIHGWRLAAETVMLRCAEGLVSRARIIPVDIIEESDGIGADTEGQRQPWWFVPGLAAVVIGALIGSLVASAPSSAPSASPGTRADIRSLDQVLRIPCTADGCSSSFQGRARTCSSDACSYSPDGTMLAYVEEGAGLYLIPIDGGYDAPRNPVARVLDQDAGEPMHEAVAWSPDGSRIAYLDFVEDSPVYGHHAYGLSFVNPDGRGLRKLVLWLPTDQAGGLVWSPDGSHLAFWMPANGPDFTPWRLPNPPPAAWRTSGPIELFVVNADGSGLRQLTHDANCRGPLTPENYWMVVGRAGPLFTVDDCRGPVWSPDGSWIYFWRGGELSIVPTAPVYGH